MSKIKRLTEKVALSDLDNARFSKISSAVRARVTENFFNLPLHSGANLLLIAQITEYESKRKKHE